MNQPNTPNQPPVPATAGPHATHAPRVFGYTRVSTSEQADSGLSLTAQAAKIRAMAALHDWPEPDIIEDAGASAKTLARPGADKLLNLIRVGGADIVIIAKLDRITRSVRDLADLLDLFAAHGVALVSVGESLDTSTAAGRLVVNILGAVAQWEREAIAERTRDALAARRAGGRRAGTVPRGFMLDPNSDDGTIIPDLAERALIVEAVRRRAAGDTLDQIAAALNLAGETTRAGKPWTRPAVHRMLAAATGTPSTTAAPHTMP